MKILKPSILTFFVPFLAILVGRMVFELYDDLCPKSAENFRCLCTGEKGETSSGAKLHYKNTLIHRVIKGFMVQGGDFTKFNGTGGESIYGGRFEDENLETKHERPGLLSMANAGKDTNGSQFFITLAPAPHLDGKHVVFGRVLVGKSVLRFVEREPIVDEKTHRPGLEIKVVDCGQLGPSDLVSTNEFEDQERSKKRRRMGSDSDTEDRPKNGRDTYQKKPKHHEGADRDDREPKKDSDEPAKPRVDAAGREIKGRGSVRSDRSKFDKRYEDQERRAGGRSEGRWKKIDEEPERGRGRFDEREMRRGRDYDDREPMRRDDRRDGDDRRLSDRRDYDDRRRGDDRRDDRRFDRRGDRHDDRRDSESRRDERKQESRDAPAEDPFGRDLRTSRGDRDSKKEGEGEEKDGESRSLVSYAGQSSSTAPPPAPKSRGGRRNAKSDKGSSPTRKSSPEHGRKSSPAYERKSSPTASPVHSDGE